MRMNLWAICYGCGLSNEGVGIIVNKNGQRFVNELGLRSHVTEAIFKHGDKIRSAGALIH